MKISVLVAASAAAIVASAASAAVLADWTFETSLPASSGPFAAELGLNAASSFASGSHVVTAAYTSPVGNGSAHSFSSTAWSLGDYYQYTTSTAGYNNIVIGWDQTSSNTGPRDFNIFISTDGTTFTQVGAMYAILANTTPNAWSSTTANPLHTYTRAAGAGADNAATLTVRFVMASTISANGGTVAAGGTDRMDNVIITGDVAPTPGSLALLGLGGLIAGRRRR